MKGDETVSMNADDLNKMYAIKWNRVTGAIWIGTVAQALHIGLSQYKQRKALATLNDKTDERSMRIKDNLQWTLIGIVQNQKEALNFTNQFRDENA